MSIRQPRPKQIRLPFSVPRPKKGEDAPARICGICRKVDSKYTCPRCNVAYCSLTCFRDQAHSQCSEPFYRTTVMDQIAADPKAEFEEKRKMMDMLRRFEEAAADGEDTIAALESEEGNEDEDELAAALEGVDLDNIDSNELLRLLPQSHRDAFLAALQDPSSSAAKELLDAALAAGEGEEAPNDGRGPPSALPWWENDSLDDDSAAHASPPKDIDSTMIDDIKPPEGVGPKLAYNGVAFCIAYIYTLLSLRLPSLSPTYLVDQGVDARQLKAELASLLPFLEPKSTIRYESLREAWGAVWDRVGKEEDEAPSPDLLVRILDMVLNLLHPPITMEPPRAVLILADLYSLFSNPKAGAIAKKIAFYRAATAQMGRQDWLRLEHELHQEIEKLKDETEARAETAPSEVHIQERRAAPIGPARIEEI